MVSRAVVLAVAAGIGLAPAVAAQPETDDRGFVDSTARCDSPDTAAAFGRTHSSRVAICKTPNGRYVYRGVRVRDGARLIIGAEPSDDGFSAENDGVTYMVTADSLVVSAGTQVLRDEAMLFFQPPAAPTPAATPAAPTTAATPTATTPLPPPLPAEEGGSGG
jgi:hypothetical protein